MSGATASSCTFLVWRDVKVRYKQAALGVTWVVLQPVLLMTLYSLIFGRFLNAPSHGAPYSAFVLAALMPWQLFGIALSQSGTSLVTNQQLVTKIHFPRILLTRARTSAAWRPRASACPPRAPATSAATTSCCTRPRRWPARGLASCAVPTGSPASPGANAAGRSSCSPATSTTCPRPTCRRGSCACRCTCTCSTTTRTASSTSRRGSGCRPRSSAWSCAGRGASSAGPTRWRVPSPSATACSQRSSTPRRTSRSTCLPRGRARRRAPGARRREAADRLHGNDLRCPRRRARRPAHHPAAAGGPAGALHVHGGQSARELGERGLQGPFVVEATSTPRASPRSRGPTCSSCRWPSARSAPRSSARRHR